MKSLQTFFTTARKKDLPFVVYRKPNEQCIQAWMQDDKNVHYVTTYEECGFLFAPFDRNKKPVLFPIESVTCYTYDASPTSWVNTVPTIQESTNEKKAHISLIQEGINAILEGEMEKVVLSRKHNIPLSDPHPHTAIERLLEAYPTAFVYCWYHPEVGLWLGATPETLLTIKNNQLETMSLAGTLKYEDTASVAWGEKEKWEQALVTEAIAQNVNPLLEKPLEIEGPVTARAGNLLHLKTTLKTTLDPATTSIKSIVRALHPTPATCGLPRDKAQEFISKNEGYDRAFYTGFLGELNHKTITLRSRGSNLENHAYRAVKKSTSLFVNLRCMQWREKEASLYVGGGITSDSIAENEWEETVNKLSTMSSIL